ncbi:DUF2383 domain-containing protein [Sorangium sp. So ce131]|uniref:DUF2383 domain-containing protein n=1 Tax=Sorangium sp. So ce131 TaxID=3133282 RepID=UPI003F5F870F
MNKTAVSHLNKLIQLDTDAVLAYQQAIDACEVSEVRRKLKSFQDDHQQHINDLAELVRASGEEPKIKRDLKGFLIEGFTALASRGDRSALLSMLGNEELSNRLYEAALKTELPGEARTVVERNREDEERHLSWIQEAIAARIWETKEGAAAVAEEGQGKKDKGAA